MERAFAPLGSLPRASVPASTGSAAADTVSAFLLLTPRESDAATIAASSEVAGLTAANLQTRDPAEKWRTDGATEASLAIALAAPVAADSVALVAHNLSDTGVIRVRGAVLEADVTSDPDVDTGWQSAWPTTGKPTVPDWPNFISLARWTAPGSFQYWQVDIADPSAALTYLEAGRLMLGQAWQPSINFDLGGTPLGFDPTDVQAKTPYGRTFTDRRTASPARLFEIALYALTKREAFDGIYEIQRLAGLAGDVVCALDPGASTDFHRFVMQGVFLQGGAYTLPPAFDADGNMFGAGARLRELI